jgi:F-type H+-transporting ATPase subunit delta
MAEHGTVARPYAQAVFELAKAGGHLDPWSRFLQLAAALVTDPAVSRRLGTPGADLHQLAGAIADICRDKLGAPAILADGARSNGANFLKLLVANRRLGALPDIAARYEVLKAEAENSLEVTLTTAAAVSDEQRAGIADSLKKRFGRDVRLSVELDPALLGGARLKVGDRVIDGTVRTGLDKLATALRV